MLEKMYTYLSNLSLDIKNASIFFKKKIYATVWYLLK